MHKMWNNFSLWRHKKFVILQPFKHKIQLSNFQINFSAAYSSTPGPVTYSSQRFILPPSYLHKRRESGYRLGYCAIVSFLGNCPTWRTNSFQCIYLFIVLYIFQACHAHQRFYNIVSKLTHLNTLKNLKVYITYNSNEWHISIQPFTSRFYHFTEVYLL